MSLVVCPRCKAPNDAPADASGRQRCMICNHLWQPQASVAVAAPAVAPVPSATAPRALRGRSTRISQEYLPDDPANEAGRALTTRQSADANAEKRPTNERGKDGSPELKPHSDRSHGGVIPPLKALPSKEEPLQIDDPPPAATRPKSPQGPARQPMNQSRVSPSTPTVEVDMDLFDRLEKEAQVNRSKQRTVAELTFDPPSNSAPPVNGQTMACPVCGHAFVATSAARAQTCPQCHTTFDHASGRFATASTGGGDPLIGRNLRGCVIDRKLGEGGMGSVYHAKQLSLDRSVAIKVLPPDLARNRNFIQRFEREAKSLAKINHPNILHIYDFGEEGSLKLYFMIIEFVDGTDLGEVLNRRNTLPQLEVLDLLRQASMGLEMAAAKGVIHRDIKPDNLMIAGDGICKVSDFGLAKGYGEENEVTSIGVRVGTPAFMSPEQCDGVEVDWRSDVYNLGCTAFLSLTGRLPFDGETPFSIMLKHKNDPIPSVRDISPSVEPAVDSLIKRMLAKRPPDRCDSWKALIDEIEDIEARLSGDPNSMRKSRGQLPALGQRPAVPEPILEEIRLPSPTSRPPSNSARDDGKRDAAASAAGAPKALPEWLKPIDVPVSALPAKEADSPPTPQPSSSNAPAVVSRGSSSANHRAVGPEAAGRSSRKLNAELVAAKDRGKRSEAESLAASAERLFSAGRFEDAAKDFRKASELTPDGDYAGQLHNRAREARSRGRMKRIMVRLTIIIILLALVAAVLYVATPLVHNLLAAKEHQQIKGDNRDAKERDAALIAFAQTQKPYDWYVMIFRTGYTISAANEAMAEADEDVLQHNQPVTPAIAADSPDLKNLEAAYNDQSVSYPEVADRAQALMKTAIGADRARVHDVFLRVQSKIDEMTPLLHQIETLVSKGKSAAALAMAKEFRANHPRSGRLSVDLPLPAMLTVQSEDGHTIEATVRLDGITLPSGEHLLCRRGDRDVVVEVSAAGFANQTLTLPADSAGDETVLNIKLKTAPLWVRSLGRGLGGRVQLHPAPEGVYVQREDGMALLRETDGLVLGTLEPLPGIQGPSYTPLWSTDASSNHIVVGGVEGLVEAIDSRSMQPQQMLYQGKADVLAWLEVNLAFKAGKVAHYLVEESHGNRRLVALDGAQEWWRYQSIPGSQPPYLTTALDKVVVIDDSIIHLIDEDGSADVTQPLSAGRSGAVLPLPKDLGVLVPTVNGVQWVRFGTQQQPITILDDAALLAAGPGAIAVSGRNLVIVHSDGVELLTLDNDHAISRWKTPLDASTLEIAIGEKVVALTDSKNRLIMLSLANGQPVARINLPTALNASPLVTTSDVVVADTDGNVASYIIHLP